MNSSLSAYLDKIQSSKIFRVGFDITQNLGRSFITDCGKILGLTKFGVCLDEDIFATFVGRLFVKTFKLLVSWL